MRKIKAVVFDLDGTIYVGNQLVEGAVEIIEYIRGKGLKVVFATNNSSKTIDELYLKLINLGLDVNKSEIYSSAFVTALFLKKKGMNDLFVIGSDGLVSELKKQNLNINMTENAKHVVVGMEQHLCEEQLLIANEILRNNEAKLVACNTDLEFPTENGEIQLGCGTVVKSVEKYTRRQTDYIIGKPNKFMMDILLKDLELNSEEVLVVGDSYTSDIEFAKTTGAMSILLTENFKHLKDTLQVEKLAQLKLLFDLPEEIKRLLELTTFENLKSKILQPYEAVLENLSNVYIFGAQRLGEKIFSQCDINGITVKGFIDNDPKKQNQLFCNRLIHSLADIKEKDSHIIIASTTYLGDISLQLKNNNYKNTIPYPILSLYNPDVFQPEFTFKDMQKDLVENKLLYISLYLRLADEKSRITLIKILLFRMTLDTTALDFKADSHYFEKDIYEFGEEEVFIDGGGYIGDTTIEFIKQVNAKYKKIFVFEPDEELLSKAKKNLIGYEHIEFIRKGIYSKNVLLGFNLTGELDGNIDVNSKNLIHVTSLDSAVSEEISFIKLDVEGAEAEALIGAENHLIKESPKLAIACYHKCEDLWYLPSVVSNINQNYRFYLRHYSQTSLETVLYCVNLR